MEELLKKMHTWMTAYMKQFETTDSVVMQGIRIKEIHTGYVTAIARELAGQLQLSLHDVQLAEMMGLFHDVGRFRQYSIYQTFNDAASEDHADLGLKVLTEEMPYLQDLAEVDWALLQFAIQNHNKKSIAPTTDPRMLVFARLLRDADKLDIYRVLSPYLAPEGADKAPKFIASDASQAISPDFIRDFAAGRQADYRNLRTHGDRKLIRLMWVYDINYSWTLRQMVARGYIDRIIRYLPEQEGLAAGLQRLRDYIEQKCAAQDRVTV